MERKTLTQIRACQYAVASPRWGSEAAVRNALARTQTTWRLGEFQRLFPKTCSGLILDWLGG